MNITLLQLDIQWCQPEENIRRAEALMQTIAPADLYVLPEMWATGFSTHPQESACSEDSSSALVWMRKQAESRRCALSGSLAIRTADGSCRNRHYFVTPEKTFYYDKHHLFTYGQEHRFFTAGDSHTVVEWQGVRFLLLTCYDLRFPLWARYGWAGEYDAIVYVANWPQSRQQAWDTLVRARAIENQCYVLAVNRVGTDPVTYYQGGSAIIDALGREVIVANNDVEQAVCGTLSIEELQRARSRFRVLDDRDMP
jgi:predicted amidohydrolase